MAPNGISHLFPLKIAQSFTSYVQKNEEPEASPPADKLDE